MKNYLKFWLVVIIGCLILLCGSTIILYDRRIFFPYRSDIHAIIRNSMPLYHEKLSELHDIVDFIEGVSARRNWVARMLLLQFERHQRGNLRWHLESLLWSRLLSLHFSDNDILVLWCHFAPFEKGMGLNESANFVYGHDVNCLQSDELFALVARTRAPRYYAEHPEVFETRLQKLLKEYHQHTGKTTDTMK